MTLRLTRRDALCCGAIGLGATAGGLLCAPAVAAQQEAAKPESSFTFCLNTGTIRGFKLSLVEEIDLTAKAGYQGIEVWMDNVHRHVESGGSLAEVKKRTADAGLKIEGAIAFPAWGVDDQAQRSKALEQIKRDMELLSKIGGLRIAVPPAGINNRTDIDLRKLGERYRAVLELGKQMGVAAQLEIWGTAKTLGRYSEAVLVAIEADHPDACLLLDVYHIYRSGMGFNGLRLLSGLGMHMLHINDYPADPPRESLTDAHRVFPGDGVAPLDEILRTLHAAGFRGALSLELFNREYWKQTPEWVASTGLEKMRKAVAKAFAGKS